MYCQLASISYALSGRNIGKVECVWEEKWEDEDLEPKS